MIQEPSGLLRDAEIAVNLVAADSVLAIHDHPDRGHPLVQTDGRVLHHGSGLERELRSVVLLAAVPAVVLLKEENVLTTAAWACDAISPAPSDKVLTAVDRITEVQNSFLERLWVAGRD